MANNAFASLAGACLVRVRADFHHPTPKRPPPPLAQTTSAFTSTVAPSLKLPHRRRRRRPSSPPLSPTSGRWPRLAPPQRPPAGRPSSTSRSAPQTSPGSASLPPTCRPCRSAPTLSNKVHAIVFSVQCRQPITGRIAVRIRRSAAGWRMAAARRRRRWRWRRAVGISWSRVVVVVVVCSL